MIPLSLLFLPGLDAQATQQSFAAIAARADAARDENRLDTAVGLYRQALALQPSWKEGWWSLATIYYDNDAYAKAAPAFQHLLRIDPKNGTAHAMLGLCQFELGQSSAALQNIQTGLGLGLLKDEALRKVVLYHEGVLLLRDEKFGTAQEALSLLASYGVSSDEAALALGMAVLRVRYRDLPPESSADRATVLQAGRAETMGAQKKLPEGDAIYADLVARAPSVPNLHYAYGRYLLLEHSPEKAVAEFEHEIKNNPDHLQSYLQIAAVRYRVDSSAGIPYAEKAVALGPRLAFPHYLLGLLCADTGEYRKAIPELEFASRTMHREPELYYALGNAYAHSGRKEEAKQARDTFKRLNDENGTQIEPNIYGDNPALRLNPSSNRLDSANEDHPH